MADNERFTRLWTQAEPTVASYVASMVRDPHACDDLIQEIAVVLLRKFDQYDPGRPFLAWAIGIAKLEIVSRRRQHARSLLSFRDDVLDAVAATYEELAPELSQRRLALRECLKRMRGRNQEMLRLRYDEALKPRQIAEKLGLAAGNVRVILNRIREALRTCVDRRLDRTTSSP